MATEIIQDQENNREHETDPQASNVNSYKTSHYLLFGSDSSDLYDQAFDCRGTMDFLLEMGISKNNPITQARRLRFQGQNAAVYRNPSDRYCDFCARPLTGIEYDKLKDGRDRCTECSQTVVRGQSTVEELFRQVKNGLSEKYSITLPGEIKIKIVSAKKLAKATGDNFVPTQYFDARTVGLAINSKGKYTMMFENGCPKTSLISTAAHELTHIWQYSNWDTKQINQKYGDYSLAIYEGMAKWAEIQYLYLLNETLQAERSLANEIQRNDVYGFGLRLFLNQYPFSTGIVLSGPTPFMNPNNPLDLSAI